MTSRAWRWSIMALIMLRVLMWWLLMNDVPKLIDHWLWQFYYGGDETLFFRVAQQMLSGEYAVTTVGAGLPLIMAGLVLFVGRNAYDQILPFIVIMNGLWLAGVSVAAMAALARSLTASRITGLWVAAAWTLLPYALWLGFGLHPEAEILRNAHVSRQMWVSGITDGPALLFVVAGMALAFRAQAAKPGRARAGWLVAAGLSMGFASAIRIHVAPVALVVVVAMLGSRRWSDVAWLLAGLFAGFGPQFWHNAVTQGHLLNTPYIQNWLRFRPDGSLLFQWNNTPISPRYLAENVVYAVTRRPLLGVLTAAMLAAGGVAAWQAWRKLGGERTLIMFGAPLASFGLHVVTYIYNTDPVRFTLPAIALGLPALAWTGKVLYETARRRLLATAKAGT